VLSDQESSKIIDGSGELGLFGNSIILDGVIKIGLDKVGRVSISFLGLLRLVYAF
jgi:hypothetical protein